MHILLLSSVDIRALHVGGGVAITFDLLKKKISPERSQGNIFIKLEWWV